MKLPFIEVYKFQTIKILEKSLSQTIVPWILYKYRSMNKTQVLNHLDSPKCLLIYICLEPTLVWVQEDFSLRDIGISHVMC